MDWNSERRADCYPIETIYGFDNIPVDNENLDPSGQPQSMLIVDDELRTARWREKLTEGMRGGYVRLIYSEMDHDGFQATLISTVFQVVDSTYVVKDIECGFHTVIDLEKEFPP